MNDDEQKELACEAVLSGKQPCDTWRSAGQFIIHFDRVDELVECDNLVLLAQPAVLLLGVVYALKPISSRSRAVAACLPESMCLYTGMLGGALRTTSRPYDLLEHCASSSISKSRNFAFR